jgi:hypothetical protein
MRLIPVLVEAGDAHRIRAASGYARGLPSPH